MHTTRKQVWQAAYQVSLYLHHWRGVKAQQPKDFLTLTLEELLTDLRH